MRTLDTPRHELTEAELDRAAAENLFGLFRAMALLPAAVLEEREEVARHRSFPQNPMFTGVWNVRAPEGRLDELLDESIEWLRARQAPFAFFWSGDDSPAGYADRLEARGLAAWEQHAPTMTCELAGLDWDALERVPPGFRIVRATEREDVETWGRAFVAAYEIPDWAGQAWIDATLAFQTGEAPWELYLGVLDGEPVATNMLVPGGGVAGVFAVGTVAAARGRGIGAAITLAGYADARKLGYRYGTLFSSPDGEPVYRRIGLRDRGTTISRHLWQREEGQTWR